VEGFSGSGEPARPIRPALKYELWVALLLLLISGSVFVPGVHTFVGSHSDRVAVTAATTLVAALACVLYFGRFWQRQHLRTLLIASALGLIASSSLAAQLLLANHVYLMGHQPTWISLCGRLIGWLLIATAALVEDRKLVRGDWRTLLSDRPFDHAHLSPPSPRPGRRLSGSTRARARAIRTVVIAGAALLALGVGGYVVSADPVNRGLLHDPEAVLSVQIAIALVASIAAWGFLRGRRRNPDPPLRLLSLAAMFGAASSIAYCSVPSLPVSRLAVGDVLRMGGAMVLLASVCLEWFLDERDARRRAVALERKRIAADVHDLIMQDLSLALATARSIADDPASAAQASAIVAAGERALAGAREVVNGLSSQDGKPVVEAVEVAARQAARDAELRFDAAEVPGDLQPDEPTQDSLVHIAREAVTNAAKHSRSRSVEVVLAYGDEWHLTVRDRGRGFDPDGEGTGEADRRSRGMGFGLESMRRRADALGGSLSVKSAPGGGTTVEAILP
jgi:signal transduction histidine kinase